MAVFAGVAVYAALLSLANPPEYLAKTDPANAWEVAPRTDEINAEFFFAFFFQTFSGTLQGILYSVYFEFYSSSNRRIKFCKIPTTSDNTCKICFQS